MKRSVVFWIWSWLRRSSSSETFLSLAIAKDKKAKLFDPAFDHDFDKWKATWDQTGILAAEKARDEQSIRDFFFFKKRDPDTGAVSAAKSGYFFSDSEYARFHTEQRVGLIRGNPKELEQWCNVFIYDIYTIGAELQQDDPKNLYERVIEIKAPIFARDKDGNPDPTRELIVVEKNTSANDFVDPGRDMPLFRLADLTRLQVWIHPPEEYLPACSRTYGNNLSTD